LRERVAVLAETVSCVRTSDRADGVTEVQRCIHTEVIPKDITTQGAFNTHRVAAGGIVTPASVCVSRLSSNKAVARC
jgi:2-keto-3-deoxy-galactonokinase